MSSMNPPFAFKLGSKKSVCALTALRSGNPTAAIAIGKGLSEKNMSHDCKN